MKKCVSFEKKSMFSVKIGVFSPPLLAVFRRHFSISQTQLHQNLVFCKPFFPAPAHTCRLTPEPVDMERKKFQDRTCMVFCPRCPRSQDWKIQKQTPHSLPFPPHTTLSMLPNCSSSSTYLPSFSTKSGHLFILHIFAFHAFHHRFLARYLYLHLLTLQK